MGNEGNVGPLGTLSMSLIFSHYIVLNNLCVYRIMNTYNYIPPWTSSQIVNCLAGIDMVL